MANRIKVAAPIKKLEILALFFHFTAVIRKAAIGATVDRISVNIIPIMLAVETGIMICPPFSEIINSSLFLKCV